jgi:predicted Zn-dependent protease
LSEPVPINIESLGSSLDTEASFIHLLQAARAQESNEEEKKDNVEGKSDMAEADESNAESNSSKETDFSKLVYLTSIDVCCSWDYSLADGKLTYRIENDDGNNDNNNDLQLKKGVIEAVKEWNTKVQNLELVDISSTTPNSSILSKKDVDIEVKFIPDVNGAGFEAGGSGQIAGVTAMRHDKDGFINKSTIILPKSFYVEKEDGLGAFASSQYSSQLKEVVIHEIGHALGLGHANFEGDIMSENVNYDGTTSISHCDVRAVSQANHWKIFNNATTPVNPTVTTVSC